MNIIRITSAVFGFLLPELVGFHLYGASLFTNLISFAQTNGAFPDGGLIQAQDGNFYGTTTSGGAGAVGILYKATAMGDLTSLATFNGTNGASPRAQLLQSSDGNFFGTTYTGGSQNLGTVFEVNTSGVLTTLVTFSNLNGAYPIGGLVQDRDGDFYGTTAIGGTSGDGTIFKLAADGTFSTLVSFDGTNGASPYAGLMEATDGHLYGTTYLGGTNQGYGTIFRLGTNGTFTSIYSFHGGTDGANPYARMIQGRDGNLYGTTYFGGASNAGTIFMLTTNGLLTTLLSFRNTNGANPQSSLIQASDGNFYGTTSGGGRFTNESGLGYGTVFKMMTNGSLTTLMSFDGTNGALPEAGLIQSSDGNFYGTTASGGAHGYGTVFRLSVIVPAPEFLKIAKTAGTITLTWSATVGQGYQMLFKTNLSQTAWSDLSGAIIATNPVMMTSDDLDLDRQRFYRIHLMP